MQSLWCRLHAETEGSTCWVKHLTRLRMGFWHGIDVARIGSTAEISR